MNYDFKNLVYDKLSYDDDDNDKNLKDDDVGVKPDNIERSYDKVTLTLDKSCFEDIGIRINYSLFNEIGQIYNVIFELGQSAESSKSGGFITLSKNFFNGKIFNKCTFTRVVFDNLFNSEFIDCTFNTCIIKSNSFKRVTLCNMRNILFADNISIRSFNRTVFERSFLEAISVENIKGEPDIVSHVPNNYFYDNILNVTTQNKRLAYTMISGNQEGHVQPPYYLIKSKNLNLDASSASISINVNQQIQLSSNLRKIIENNFSIGKIHKEELYISNTTRKRSSYPEQDRDSRNPELNTETDWHKIYKHISISQNGNLISIIDNYRRKIIVKNVVRNQETSIEYEEDTRDDNELNREDFMRYRWEKVLNTRFIYSGTVLVVIALVMRRGSLDELVGQHSRYNDIKQKLGMYYDNNQPIEGYQKEYFYPYLQVEEILYDVYMTRSSISVSYSQRNVFEIPELKHFVINTEIKDKIPDVPDTDKTVGLSPLYGYIKDGGNINNGRVTTEHADQTLKLYNDDYDNDRLNELYRLPQYQYQYGTDEENTVIDKYDIKFYKNNGMGYSHEEENFFKKKIQDSVYNILKLNIAYNYTYRYYDTLVQDYGKLFINFDEIGNASNLTVDNANNPDNNPDNIFIGEKEAGSQIYFYKQFHYIALRYLFERRVMEMIRKYVDESYIDVTCSNSKEQFYLVLIRFVNPLMMTYPGSKDDNTIVSKTRSRLFLSNTTNESIIQKIDNFGNTGTPNHIKFANKILDMTFNFEINTTSDPITSKTYIDIVRYDDTSYKEIKYTYTEKPYKISESNKSTEPLSDFETKSVSKGNNTLKVNNTDDPYLSLSFDSPIVDINLSNSNNTNKKNFNAGNIKYVKFAETSQENIAIVVEFDSSTNILNYSIFTISNISNEYDLELNKSYDDDSGSLELYNMNLKTSNSYKNIYLRNINILYDYSTFKILEMSNIYLINTILKQNDYALGDDIATLNNISFKQCILEDVKGDNNIMYENANNMYFEECIFKTPIAKSYKNITMYKCYNSFNGPLISDGSSDCDVSYCYADGSHGQDGVHGKSGNSIFGKYVTNSNISHSYCKNSLFADDEMFKYFDISKNASERKTVDEISQAVSNYCINKKINITKSYCYEYLVPGNYDEKKDYIIGVYDNGTYNNNIDKDDIYIHTQLNNYIKNVSLRVRNNKLRITPSHPNPVKIFSELDYVNVSIHENSNNSEDIQNYIYTQLNNINKDTKSHKDNSNIQYILGGKDKDTVIKRYNEKLREVYEYRKFFNKDISANNKREERYYVMIDYPGVNPGILPQYRYFNDNIDRHPFSHVIPNPKYLEGIQKYFFQNINLSYMNFSAGDSVYLNEDTNFKGTVLYDVTSEKLSSSQIIKMGKNTQEEGKYQIINGVILGKGVNVSENITNFKNVNITGIEMDNDTDLTKTVFTDSKSSNVVFLNNGKIEHTSISTFPSYGHTRIINGYLVGDGINLSDANLENGDLSELILLNVKMNNNTNLKGVKLENTRVNPGFQITSDDDKIFNSDKSFPSYPYIMVKKGILFGQGVDLRYDYYTLSFLDGIQIKIPDNGLDIRDVVFDLSGIDLNGEEDTGVGINLSRAILNNSSYINGMKLNNAEGENIRKCKLLDNSNNIQVFTSFDYKAISDNNNNMFVNYSNDSKIKDENKIYIIEGFLIGNGVNLKSKTLNDINLNNVVFYKMNLYNSIINDCEMIGTKFIDCYVEYNQMTYNKVKFNNTPKVIKTEMSFTNIITDPEDTVVNQITKSNQNRYQNISGIVWRNLFEGIYNAGKIYFQNAKFGSYSQKIIYFHFESEIEGLYNMRLMIFNKDDKLVLLYKKDDEELNVATTIQLDIDYSILNDDSKDNIQDELTKMQVKYNTINSVIISTKEDTILYYLYTQNPTYYIQYKPYNINDNLKYSIYPHESLHGFVYHIHKMIYILYFREPEFYNNNNNDDVSGRYKDRFILKTYETVLGKWNPLQKISKDYYNFYVITKSSVLQKNNGSIVIEPINFLNDAVIPRVADDVYQSAGLGNNPHNRINENDVYMKYVVVNNSHSKNNTWEFKDNSGNIYEHFFHHVVNKGLTNNIYIHRVEYNKNTNDISFSTLFADKDGAYGHVLNMQNETDDMGNAGNIAYGLIRNNSIDENKRMDYVFMDTTNLNVYTSRKLPYYIDDDTMDISGDIDTHSKGTPDIKFKNMLPVMYEKYPINIEDIDFSKYKYFNYDNVTNRKTYGPDEMNESTNSDKNKKIIYLQNDIAKRITLKNAFSHQVYYSTSIDSDVIERIYYIPYDENFIGIYDIRSKELSGYTIEVNGPGKYSHGVLLDKKIYLIPFNADHIGLFDISIRQFNKIYVKSNLLKNDINMAGSYSSGILVDKFIYLVPYNASYFTYFNTTDNSMNFMSFDKYESKEKFKSARYIDNQVSIIYAPYNYNDIVIFDIVGGDLKMAGHVTTLPSVNAKFSSIFIQETTIDATSTSTASVYLLPEESETIYYFKYVNKSVHPTINKNISLPDTILSSEYIKKYSFSFYFNNILKTNDASYNKLDPLPYVYMFPKEGNDVLKINMNKINEKLELDNDVVLDDNECSIVKVNNIIGNYPLSYKQGINIDASNIIILTPYNYNHVGYLKKTELEDTDKNSIEIYVDYELKQTEMKPINVSLKNEYSPAKGITDYITSKSVTYEDKTPETDIIYTFTDYPEPNEIKNFNKSLQKARDALKFLFICLPPKELQSWKTFNMNDHRLNDDTVAWEEYYNWGFTFRYGDGWGKITDSTHKIYPFRSLYGSWNNIYGDYVPFHNRSVLLLAHPLETFISPYTLVDVPANTPFNSTTTYRSNRYRGRSTRTITNYAAAQKMYDPTVDGLFIEHIYGNGYTNCAEELYTYIEYDKADTQVASRFFPEVPMLYPHFQALKIKNIKDQIYLNTKNINIKYNVKFEIKSDATSKEATINGSHNFLKTICHDKFIYSLYKDTRFYDVFDETFEGQGIYNLYITDTVKNESKLYKLRLHKVTEKIVTKHDYIHETDNMSKLDKEYEIIPFHSYMYFNYLNTNFKHTIKTPGGSGSYQPKIKCIEDFLIMKDDKVDTGSLETKYIVKPCYVPLSCEDMTCMELGEINEGVHTIYIGTELGFIKRYDLNINNGDNDEIIVGETIFGYGMAYSDENMKLLRETSSDEFTLGDLTLSLKDDSIINAYNRNRIDILDDIKSAISKYYKEKYVDKKKDVVITDDNQVITNTLKYFFGINIDGEGLDESNETKLKEIEDNNMISGNYFQQDIIQCIAEVLIMNHMIKLSDTKEKEDTSEIKDEYDNNYDMNKTNIADIYKQNFAYRKTKYTTFLSSFIKIGHSMYNDYVRYNMIYEYFQYSDILVNVSISKEPVIGIKDSDGLKKQFKDIKDEIWDHPIPHYIGESQARNSYTPESMNFHLKSNKPYVASDVYGGISQVNTHPLNFNKSAYRARSRKYLFEYYDNNAIPTYKGKYARYPEGMTNINEFDTSIDAVSDNNKIIQEKTNSMSSYLLMRTSENFTDSESYDKEYGLSTKYLKGSSDSSDSSTNPNLVYKVWDQDTWNIGTEPGKGIKFSPVGGGFATYNEYYFRLPIVNMKSKLDGGLTNFAIYNIKHLGDQVIAVYKNSELFTMDTTYRKTSVTELVNSKLVNSKYQSKVLFPTSLPYVFKNNIGERDNELKTKIVYDDIIGGKQNKIQRFNHYYFDRHIKTDLEEIPYLALLRSENGTYDKLTHISLYKFEKSLDILDHKREVDGVEELINEDVMYSIQTVKSNCIIPNDVKEYIEDIKGIKMFSLFSNIKNDDRIYENDTFDIIFIHENETICNYYNYSLTYNTNLNDYNTVLQKELEIELTKNSKIMTLNDNISYVDVTIKPVTKNKNYDYYNYQYNYEYNTHVSQHMFRPLELMISTYSNINDVKELKITTLITFPKYKEWYKNIHNVGISVNDTMIFFSGGFNSDSKYLVFEYNHIHSTLHVMDIPLSYVNMDIPKIDITSNKNMFPLSIKRNYDTIVHLLPLKTLNINSTDNTTELFSVVFTIENESSNFTNVKEVPYIDGITYTRNVKISKLLVNIYYNQFACEYIYIDEFNSIFSIPLYSNKMVQFKLNDEYLVEAIFIHDVSSIFSGVHSLNDKVHYYYTIPSENDIANEYYASYYSTHDKLLYLAPYKSKFFSSLDMNNVTNDGDNQIIHILKDDSKHFKIDITAKIEAMEQKYQINSDDKDDKDNKYKLDTDTTGETVYNLYATRLSYHDGAFYIFSHYYNAYIILKMNGLKGLYSVNDRFEYVKIDNTYNAYDISFASSDIGNDTRKAIYDDVNIELDEAPLYFENFKYYTSI